MKTKIRLASCIMALVMLLSACGGGTQSSSGGSGNATPNTTADSGSADSTAGGGTHYKEKIVVAVPIEPSGTDIHEFGDSATNQLMYMLYDPLVRLDPDTLEPVPGLAESWDISDDGTVYTFHLRQGVLFSDGSELKAEDVKWSFERQIEMQRNAQKLEGIVSIDAASDYDVVLNLDAPNVPLIVTLANSVCGIASHHCMDTGEFVPIATGPYTIEDWQSGYSITFKRNENHYYEIPTETVVFRVIPEESAAMMALEVGEVDVVTNVSPINYSKVIDNPDLKLQQIADMGIEYVMWNVTTGAEPLRDKRVRQALSLATDRDEIIQVVLEGQGTPINTCVGYGVPHQKTNFNVDYGVYDLDRAKALLAEAGYADGFSFTMLVKGNQQQLTAQVLQAQYKKINVDMDIQFIENTAFFDALNHRNFDAGMITRGNTTGDPATQVNFLYGENVGSAGNRGYWINERWDELYRLQMSESDFDKRDAYFSEMQDIFMDEQPWLVMFCATKGSGMVNGMEGVVLHSTNNEYRDAYIVVD